MGYIPSINIEHNKFSDFRYIVTENAKLVVSGIINGYNAGHHSFTIIGTYGTGKSSLIELLKNKFNPGVPNRYLQNYKIPLPYQRVFQGKVINM